MDVDDEDSLLEVEERPGVRLKKLRNDLQDEIAKRKSALWQNKSAKPDEKVGDDEDDESSKPDYEAEFDDILDNEDEEEMSESSEEEDVDDDEEIVEQKSTKKSAFIDEEAEESDAEDDENDDEDNEEIMGNVRTDSDKENEEADAEATNEEKQEVVLVKKPLRRILKGFTEDSDDEDEVVTNPNPLKQIPQKLNGMDDVVEVFLVLLYFFLQKTTRSSRLIRSKILKRQSKELHLNHIIVFILTF